jgi:hypothetical protein
MRHLERKNGLRALERALRHERPRPTANLMSSLAPARSRRAQLVVAVALSATLAIALASFGGVSYAANAVVHVAVAAKKIVVPASTKGAVVVKGLSSGGDQYKPGYGFGDPNHNHAGPPGLTKGKPGEKTPPAQIKRSADGKAIIVTTSITSDEQAALYFSVLDAQGNELLLTQQGTTLGSKVAGPQTKSIHYVMLVPRTIPIELRIPANLLVPGQTYRLRVIAVDAQGNKSSTTIQFTA